MIKITNAILGILAISVTVMTLQSQTFGETSHALDFPIGLKVGETADIDSDLKMILLAIEDSRCPSDVQCVWQGAVTAKINLKKGTQDLGTHSLSLAEIVENEKTFDGYYIRLTNVEPYPESTKPIKQEDYILTFFVSEGEMHVDSPLKQFKKGIPVDETKCRDGLVLMIKISDSTPSCVYFSALEKLTSRGWGEIAEDQSIQPIIKTGTKAGFCIGYCVKEFVITPDKIIYTNGGRSFGDTPDPSQITKEIPFSDAEWKKLVDLVDFKKFSSLPDRIGCPGCADAPVEWIEITYADKTKRIEFEHGDEIQEITKLVLALQTIRSPIESAIESFEECVAAGNPVMESYPRQCRTDGGKSFVEEIDSPITLEFQCTQHGGKWLSEWNECEYVSEQQCLEMNGNYNECESACRHDANAEVCTAQCVPVCVIS